MVQRGNVTHRGVLASSASRCRFVDTFVRPQSSLPCFPSAALTTRRPPYPFGSRLVRFPGRLRYYEGATTSTLPSRSLICFASDTNAVLLCSRSPRAALSDGWRSAWGRDQCPAGDPMAGSSHWTWLGHLRFPGDPSGTLAPVQDPGGTDAPAPLRSSARPPLSGTTKAPACKNFEATALLCTCCLRFKAVSPRPCRTRFRLPGCGSSGWD